MTEPTFKLYDYFEAADILGLSHNTLRQWVSRKRVPYTKLGKRTVFTSEQLHQIVQAGQREAEVQS